MYKLKRKTLLIFSIILVAVVIATLLLSTNSSLINSGIISKRFSANDTSTDAKEFVFTADQLIANKTDSSSISQNTKHLQLLVDKASSSGGGIVHIPAGTYYFGTTGKSTNGAQDYVIHCKNNVTIEGEGASTILKPYGTTDKGLDMFYYNEYADSNYKNPKYLVNADFRGFVIDGSDANCITYTTAGKGFMINLYRDCDWQDVTVKYTDGTGFGMDCPINSTIVNCVAIGCGKAASTTQNGASGFGIGMGYSIEETILIENCVATDNKKYGIFFEHQGRFKPKSYTKDNASGFIVRNCQASGNMYDFGGEYANNVVYENCTSMGDSLSSSYVHFDNNSRFIDIANCDVQHEFTDVTDKSAYYYEPVYWALNNGITDGVSKDKFGVDSKMKRGQVIVTLWRMKGRPGVHFLNENGNIFDDVPADSEYAAALGWASATNVEIVPASGSFYPDKGCTRADFITFLWRYAGKPSVSIDVSFEDIPSGSDTEKAVNWAIDKGITNGIEGIFQADHICEREDIMTFLYRYEQAEGIKFDISYGLLGGIMDRTNYRSYKSGSSTFTIGTPTKTGYKFKGWTGSNGGTPEKSVRLKTNDRGNKTYTANWERNTYTIKFDANGGTGNVTDLRMYYDELNALPSNSFRKEGAKFIGWNTRADGRGDSFEEGERILNLTATNDDIITLYAQWENMEEYNATFKVEHYKEGLDGQYKLEETDNYEGIAGEEATPDRKTYQGFTSPEGQTVTIETDGSTVVQYYYTRNSYNLTINKGIGIASVTGEGTYKFDQSVTISATTNEGYENPIWMLKGTPISDTFLMPAGDIELDVSAQAIKYPITYNLDGGEMASNPSEYTIEDEVILREPIKPGYDFIGWTGSNGTTPQKEVTIPKGSTGEKNYTANWVEDPDADMEVVIKYSITSPTRDDVTVTIKANVPINVPNGWQRGKDEYTITRQYEQNIKETVIITSTGGVSIQANIEISNIDKTGPKVQVAYDYIENEKKVIVTLTANEEVQDIETWETQDNIIFTKTYTENTKENIVVRDIVGNETSIEIKIDQIKDGSGEEPDNSGENPDTPGEDLDNPGEEPGNSNNQNNNSNDNNNGDSSHLINTEKADDKTTSNSILPQTGNNILFVLISIIAIVVIGAVSFIKLKKLKDIK